MAAAPRDASSRSAPLPTSYADTSRRPLPSLVLLFPLLVFHELGVIFGGAHQADTVVAYRKIEQGIDTFGTVFVAAPAVLTVVLLLGLHLVRRDPWTIRPHVPPFMALEAVIWAVALFAVQIWLEGVLLAAPSAGTGGTAWIDRLTLAFGAGLYEELVFRLLLVGGGYWAITRIFPRKTRLAAIGSVLASAILFAFYHDLGAAAPGEQGRLLVVYLIGGVFFGTIYLLRGFGIVAAAHAGYDVLVIALGGGASGV